MNRPRQKVAVISLLALPLALTFSSTALAATAQLTLASEGGSKAGVAEGNESLVYAITINNDSSEETHFSVTETIPDGTSYARGDDFLGTCTGDGVAGDTCTVNDIAVPANSVTTLHFAAKVNDPVTTAGITNIVAVTGVDCSAGAGSDCNEYLVTDGVGTSSGFTHIHPIDWDETRVRKVLHAFAYGGLASEQQISIWADMEPEAAVAEMLTFSYTNEKLSPAQGASANHAASLASLQDFWSSNEDPTNPMRWDKRTGYAALSTVGSGPSMGQKTVSIDNLELTWSQAVNTRGINPFLHRIGHFLTNYHMAIRSDLSTPGLFRSYYDDITADLVNGNSFTEVIANASKSAAVAFRYKHRSNTYNNNTGVLSGNDDFAREYFQLFFRYLPDPSDPLAHEYHEEVNIENNAELLTGMGVDRDTGAYGVAEGDILNVNHRWVAPIQFMNHTDAAGFSINNYSNHHLACMEIFQTQICGSTAAEKIDLLSAIMSTNPEVMASLPLYIIQYLADDNLDDNEKAKIRAAWAKSGDNLLTFIRDYAASTTFHSKQVFKYRNTFDRNLTLRNTVVLTNTESFIANANSESSKSDMAPQGGYIFRAVHDVFGGQTGLEAANNPAILKSAYDIAANYPSSRLGRQSTSYYPDPQSTTTVTWDKEWGPVVPKNANGQYIVNDVANWLWQRITGDGGKNFDPIARAQVIAILARGYDFGYVVTQINPGISTDPEALYSSEQLTTDPDLVVILNQLGAEVMYLDNGILGIRRTENKNVSWAANFIATLPYTFALEGK